MATSKQTYYDLSTMLLKVAATLPDALVKSKVCCCHTMVLAKQWPLVSHVCCLQTFTCVTALV